MNRIRTFAPIVLTILLTVLAACGPSDGDVYTLYRSSPIDPNMRIHIATFNAADGEQYNSENCRIGSGAFRAQPGVTVRYWCEKGQFRK